MLSNGSFIINVWRGFRNMYDDLKNYCLELQKNKRYRQILGDAFEMSFRMNKDNMNVELQNYLIINFKANPQVLIEYMCIPEYFTADEIGIADNGLVNFLNDLKVKYGVLIAQSQEKVKRPFGLKNIQLSIGKGQSHHIITLTRVDGETLMLSTALEDLINLSESSTHAFVTALAAGSYNINENQLKVLSEKLQEATNAINEKLSEANE